MTDLLARLAQRPFAPHRLSQADRYSAPDTVAATLTQAEFDRDLALDALAKAVVWIDEMNAHFGPCDHSVGICQCADLRMADEFRTILRELRPQQDAGDL